jgi:tape measure domain-containing protein
MLGSAQRARSFLGELQGFAAKTPFEFPELVRASQRMIAFGFSSKQVIPTLTAIGDAAAGLGVGAEGVDRIVGAIGQMQAKGKVQSEELLQLTEVGVPALRILANQFGVSTQKMQEMVTAGAVPASKAIPALLAGISKGTKGAAGQTTAFAGLMQRQSTTLIGVWSNFVDVANRRLGQLVAPALPFVKRALSGLTALMTSGIRSAFSGAGTSRTLTAVRGLGTSIARFVTTSLLPSLRNLATALTPTLRAVGSLAASIVVPALRAIGWVLTGVVGPALLSVTGLFARHKIALQGVLTVIGAGLAAYAALKVPMLVMTAIVRGVVIVTRLWAAAQALLNLALNANPIGLVVIALAALVAGLVFTYRHSQTFRTIVQAAWQGIVAVAMWAWNTILKPIFNALRFYIATVVIPQWRALWATAKVVFTAIGFLVRTWWAVHVRPTFTLVKWIITRVVIPYIKILFAQWRFTFNAIRFIVRTWWAVHIRPVFMLIRAVIVGVVIPVLRRLLADGRRTWNTLASTVRAGWNAHIRPTFDRLRTGLTVVRAAFATAVANIRTTWARLRAAAREPVAFVIHTVFNRGIVRMWNAVARLVPGVPGLSPLHFAAGGVYPGYTPGRDIGLAAVSGGEAIMRPEFTRAVGEDFIHAINTRARRGGVTAVARYLAGVGDPTGLPGFAGNFALGGIIDDFIGAAKGYFANGLKNTAARAFAPLLATTDRALAPMGGLGKLVAGIPRALVGKILTYFGPLEERLGGPGRRAVHAARRQLGVRYSWGGGSLTGPSRGIGRGAGTVGFDCSALTRYAIYQATKKVAPRTTYGQRPWARPVGTPREGDLGFPHAGHVFMFAGRGRIIEAPYTGARVRQVTARRADWRRPPAYGRYDTGGWLQPGLSLAYNSTRRPEPVLSHHQWRQLAALAADRSAAGSTEYHAHFDGASSAQLQTQVRAAFHAMSTAESMRERIGRRR